MLGASATTAYKSKFVPTTVDHPRITVADASSIHFFLSIYDQYVSELQERARELVTQDAVTTEIVNPVNIKFCLGAECLESTVTLGFIDCVTSVDRLTNCRLRKYLDGQAEESKKVVKLSRNNSASTCVRLRRRQESKISSNST